MKWSTKLIHSLIFNLSLEPFFYTLSHIYNKFTKFIPPPTYYKGKPNVIVKRDGVYFSIQRSDYMQWHIYAGLEDYSWKSALEYLNEDCTVLDIGANSGAFSLKLAEKSLEMKVDNIKVHAFEPNPLMAGVIGKNLALNKKLKNKVKICDFAIGNEDGYCSIAFDESNSGAGHIVEDNGTKIRIRTIDSYLEQENIKNVSFIKIDVEGFEPDVLRGAYKTIEKQKPTIFMEMTDEWFVKRNSSTAIIIDKLLAWNYNLLIEIDDEMIPYDRVKNNLHSYRQYNLLAAIE